MKRILPVAIVAVLIAASVAISLNVGGGSTEGTSDIVDLAVWEALEEQDEIEVYVGLRKLNIPLAEQTTEMRRAHAATVQATVLSALSAEEFELKFQYSTIPSFVGYITKAGVRQLAAHPDVRGIVIPGVGERL